MSVLAQFFPSGNFFPTGNELAFYEVAATLIPLLLFGGVVAERITPTGTSPSWLQFAGVMIVVMGCYAIFAEVLAINVIVIGKPTRTDEIVILAFLLIGMVAAVVALAAPWFKRLREKEIEEDEAFEAAIREAEENPIFKEASRGQGQKEPPIRSSYAKRLLLYCTGPVLALLVLVVPAVRHSLVEASNNHYSPARSVKLTQLTIEVAAVRSRCLALSLAALRVKQQKFNARSRHEPMTVIDRYQSELTSLKERLTGVRGHGEYLAAVIKQLHYEEAPG